MRLKPSRAGPIPARLNINPERDVIINLNNMQTKSIFLSRTFWFNALTIVIAIATFFGFTPNADLFKTVTAFLLAAGPLINLILRTQTTQAVTL